MCTLCKCEEAIPSRTTHVVDYNNCIIVIKNVPCEECVQCGEKFYSSAIVKKLDEIVTAVKKLHQELSIIDFDKVA